MKTRANIKPTDRKMGARTIALGTVAFLALSGGFFFLGLVCLGPALRQYINPRPRAEQATQVPSGNPSSESPTETPSQPAQTQPQVDVQITEEGEGQQSASSGETTSQDSGVKQDESGITVTLEPKSDAEKPSPPEKGKAVSSRDAGTQPEAPVSGTRAYRVQAGTFANRTNAESLAADLRQRGYKPEIKPVQREAGTLYRVEMGSFKTREDAQGLADDLSRKGYSPTISAEHKPE